MIPVIANVPGKQERGAGGREGRGGGGERKNKPKISIYKLLKYKEKSLEGSEKKDLQGNADKNHNSLSPEEMK